MHSSEAYNTMKSAVIIIVCRKGRLFLNAICRIRTLGLHL